MIEVKAENQGNLLTRQRPKGSAAGDKPMTVCGTAINFTSLFSRRFRNKTSLSRKSYESFFVSSFAVWMAEPCLKNLNPIS